MRGDIIFNDPIIESAPINNPGQVTNTVIVINDDNSNLVDLLETSPSRINMNVSGITNPQDLNAINFVQPTSFIEGDITVEIPMEIQLNNLTQDVFFDLGNGVNVNDVDSAYLRIVTVNEFPFSTSLALSILNDSLAQDSVVYEAPEDIVMNAPFIDLDGLVTDASGASADIILSQAGIDALGSGTRMRMRLTLNTPVSQTSRDIFVKILANYTLEIKVGVGGKLNLDL